MTSKGPDNSRKGSKKAASVPELTTLGRYDIDKLLGAGGMGAVYRATDRQLKRVVALKVLPKEKARNELLVKRFQSEAQAAASLRHENIIGVYDSGECDGYLYIAMELVEGIDVHELVARKGPVEPKRALDIIRQVAMALQHAHEQQIVHRDIKPANLMIMRDGSVKLADMGLARSIGDTEEAGITRAGTTVGTVDFMSPEQARDSKSADCRSDIYSLGATWYQMLTAKAPYPEGDLLNKITAHANAPIPDPRKFNPDIPEGTVDIIHRMLAKKPDDRYQTPADLLDDLKNANNRRASITTDLLAALAEGDDFEDSGDTAELKRTPARSRSERSPETRTNSDSSPVDLLALLDSEAEVATPTTDPGRAEVTSTGSESRVGNSGGPRRTSRPAARDRAARPAAPAEKSARPKKASRGAAPSRDDNRDAIPSARDVMLRRGTARRHGSGSVSFNATRLIGAIVAVIVLMVLAQVVMSSLSGDSGTAAPAGTIQPAGR